MKGVVGSALDVIIAGVQSCQESFTLLTLKTVKGLNVALEPQPAVWIWTLH